MSKTYGKFEKELAGYTVTSLPGVGSYEYIYKNDSMLLKLDQFGISFAQITPPTGIALIKREKREISSPAKVYFDIGEGVHNNFDVFTSDDLKISFLPECATYELKFGSLDVKTELIVPKESPRFIFRTTFKNTQDKDRKLKLLSVAYPYVNELMMAPWDKPEWYTRTEYQKANNAFLTTRYSIAGIKEERKFLTLASSAEFDARELSAERLTADTKNYTYIPEKIGEKTEDVLYSFEQCMAGVLNLTLKAGEEYTLTQVYAVAGCAECVDREIALSKEYFENDKLSAEKLLLKEKYEKLFSVKKINTRDEVFNRFINGFLPIELDWVSSLDRGWPTGMRGVRDASNDFQGFLSYSKDECRAVIENIFSKQRSDGWYPRQVPFGEGKNFDMREFVDSACFFTEFVYDYLAYTDDYSVLEKEYPYHDSDKLESGLVHLQRGMDYLIAPENTGEHGLVKMRGGDWLDCLNKAGILGRGETVMVSCQLTMCLSYLIEIQKKLHAPVLDAYISAKKSLVAAINKSAYNSKGFYNAVFADSGNWLFSEKDEDGEERIYVPTNSYAIISGVAEGKEQGILEKIHDLRTDNGYKLFTKPLGEKYIGGIGKMGTGDFQPYFAENGSVYNHGSQCFLLRALAKVGAYSDFFDVLGFAMPLYADKHAPENVCGAPYAITNCYHLVPSFRGRSGFSFLTGSVAMIERAVYSWMFGFNFTLNEIVITPCLPEQFRDASAYLCFEGKKINLSYSGYGAKITSARVNGTPAKVSEDGRSLIIDKSEVNSDLLIEVELSEK